MLLRARKHKLVDFEGEMLYQRQDEDVIITLLKPFEEVQVCEHDFILTTSPFIFDSFRYIRSTSSE